MEVKVTKFKIVKPIEKAPELHLWTSNCDSIVLQIHIGTIYLYPPLHSSPISPQKEGSGGGDDGDDVHGIGDNIGGEFFSWEVLEASLAKVLAEFYPLAGRLKKAESDGRVGIECNGEGALLTEAIAPNGISIADIGNFTPVQSLIPFVPNVAYSEDIGSYPLLLVQVTRFRCGGVSLGVQMHHHVVDGTSSIHFINAWAETTRRNMKGMTWNVIPKPFFDRTLLKARYPPIPSYPHIEYHPPPVLIKPDGKDYALENEPIVSSIFRLDLEQVKALKSLAVGGDSSSSYTTYEVLSSHIWRCVSKARALGPSQQSKLRIAVNARPRMQPPLPDGYFGNAAFVATANSSVADLTSKPLSYGANLIQRAIARMNNDYLRSALDYLQLQQYCPKKLVHGSHMDESPNLAIISWARFPIHDADFGWGKSIFMSPVNAPNEGHVVILPSPSGDGSLYINTDLFAHHMQAFKLNLYQI